MNASLFFDVSSWMLGAGLGWARLSPLFFVLPFFNSTVLSGATRNAVIMIVAMGFWPVPVNVMVDITLPAYFGAIAQELVIGVILAFLLSWPFWIFHAIGGLIDNQRGATLSSTIDPANGVDSSELANFFNLFAAALYLQRGGLIMIIEAISDSYRLCDPLQACSFSATPLLPMLSSLASHMIIISSPVVSVMLLCEFTLGLLSRFAPQLNAFSVSMTVKSVIALGVLLIYFVPVYPDELDRLSREVHRLGNWFHGAGDVRQ